MTPVTIELLLKAYYLGDGIQLGQSQAHDEGIRYLESNGLIRYDVDTFRATEKGHAMVSMICRIPIPVKKTVWVDPRETEEGDFDGIIMYQKFSHER